MYMNREVQKTSHTLDEVVWYGFDRRERRTRRTRRLGTPSSARGDEGSVVINDVHSLFEWLWLVVDAPVTSWGLLDLPTEALHLVLASLAWTDLLNLRLVR